jgi:hypothetical protein
MKKTLRKKCEFCHCLYETHRATQKYCNRSCYADLIRKKRDTVKESKGYNMAWYVIKIYVIYLLLSLSGLLYVIYRFIS